jgi:hypothetical protein
MSCRFTIINTHWAFMKKSESGVLKIKESVSESELLCTNSTALIRTAATRIFFFSKTTRPTLGPTQPQFNLYQRLLLQGQSDRKSSPLSQLSCNSQSLSVLTTLMALLILPCHASTLHLHIRNILLLFGYPPCAHAVLLLQIGLMVM